MSSRGGRNRHMGGSREPGGFRRSGGRRPKARPRPRSAPGSRQHRAAHVAERNLVAGAALGIGASEIDGDELALALGAVRQVNSRPGDHARVRNHRRRRKNIAAFSALPRHGLHRSQVACGLAPARCRHLLLQMSRAAGSNRPSGAARGRRWMVPKLIEMKSKRSAPHNLRELQFDQVGRLDQRRPKLRAHLVDSVSWSKSPTPP